MKIECYYMKQVTSKGVLRIGPIFAILMLSLSALHFSFEGIANSQQANTGGAANSQFATKAELAAVTNALNDQANTLQQQANTFLPFVVKQGF